MLFDPIAPPDEVLARADGRELIVVLTNPWHERDTRALVEKHDPPVFVTQPEDGSPDLEWLLSGEAGKPHLYSAGDGLKIHEPWLSTPREQVVGQLLPLLDFPVEHVLATHGGPHDRAALERALG